MSGMSGDSWNRRQFGWHRALMASPLTASTRVVGLALASFANAQSGECWPGVAEIAETAGVSTRTVLRALPALEDAGLIEVDRRCGRGRSSLYRMVVPASVAGNVVSMAAVSAPRSAHARPVDNCRKPRQPVTVSQSEKVTFCPSKGDILSVPYKEELPGGTSCARGASGVEVSRRRWDWCRGGVVVPLDGSAVARWRRWCAERGIADPVTLCPAEGEGLRLPGHTEPDAGGIDETLALALFRALEAEAAQITDHDRRQA